MKKAKSEPLRFHKMVASGNDFIVFDNRSRSIRHPAAVAKTLCPNHTGIGADGVLLLEPSKKAAFKMRILNSDGSEAEACGNGFRCIALYAHERLGLASHFRFESLAGIISAEVSKPRVKVGMVPPRGYGDRKTLEVLGHRLHYSFINTGVPHVVILAEGLSKIDVAGLGRAIREHPAFRPKGTNVNFVEIQERHTIRVRTYERGVEAETLACGTGATASALVTALSGYTQSSVQVQTAGGEILTVGFRIKEKKVSEVTLEGEAHFVYEGVLMV